MRRLVTLSLLLLVGTLACQAPVAFGKGGRPIFRQTAISDIACGPSSLYNWLSHGDARLQGVLEELTAERTPQQTVQHLIDTYGRRRSATNPSVARYGRHNGGVGSVNLMLMARELLAEHLEAPPDLRGEYLQGRSDEPPERHLGRVASWLRSSIDDGVPAILYLRRYERTADRRHPRMVFGHHVVVTSVGDETVPGPDGQPQIPFTFVDSASGRADEGFLAVAAQEFTAPTYTYHFDGDRALTQEEIRRGRPLLETRVASYERGRSSAREIMLAHFATFAATGTSTASPH